MSSAPVKVTFQRLASREYREARRWYSRRGAAVGDRFRDAVLEAIRPIEASPLAAPIVFGRFHQLRVRRFPYTLNYLMVSPTEAVLMAVAHTSRRPGYWRRRTP